MMERNGIGPMHLTKGYVYRAKPRVTPSRPEPAALEPSDLISDLRVTLLPARTIGGFLIGLIGAVAPETLFWAENEAQRIIDAGETPLPNLSPHLAVGMFGACGRIELGPTQPDPT